MYAQITNQCNMTCPHCCFSHKPIKNADYMDWSTWIDVLRCASNNGEHLTIGGGEPTTHPNFKNMVLEALNYPGIENIWMATNGKITSTMWWLVELMDQYGEDRITVNLSNDAFHDLIDEDVEEYFRRNKLTHNVTGIQNVGRAIETGVATREGCACTTDFIKPNGEIRQCGCDGAPIIGIADEHFTYPDDYFPGECYRNEPYISNDYIKLV